MQFMCILLWFFLVCFANHFHLVLVLCKSKGSAAAERSHLYTYMSCLEAGVVMCFFCRSHGFCSWEGALALMPWTLGLMADSMFVPHWAATPQIHGHDVLPSHSVAHLYGVSAHARGRARRVQEVHRCCCGSAARRCDEESWGRIKKVTV